MEQEGYSYQSVRVSLGDAEISLFRFRTARSKEKAVVFHANSTSLHRHGFYELQLVKEGRYPFKTANSTVEMAKGELMIIPPESLHFSFMAGQDFAMRVVSFSLRRLEEGYPLYDALEESLRRFAGRAIPTPAALRERIVFWAENAPATAVESVRDQISAVNLFGELIEVLGVGQGDLHDAGPKGKEGAVPLILDTMVSDGIYSLADIARELNYSERQTARLIQKTYGESLAKLRRLRRARTLRQLLVAEPDASVSLLAQRAGYSGSALAYADFRRFYGQTPEGFRQLLREGKVPPLLPEEDEKLL